MALVQGEDTESDEEINTDQLQHLTLTPDGSLKGYPKLTQQQESRSKAGIVAGEGSETDEEDEGDEGTDETDGGKGQSGSLQMGEGRQDQPGSQPQSLTGSVSLKETGRKASQDSSSSAPQSLLHKKLRESNNSLRRNIVERVLKIYYTTCRNLNTVIENLNKAQLTIEKVNAHLKRSDNELTQLNTIMEGINEDARKLAPNIQIVVPPAAPKKKVQLSPLRLRHRGQQPKLGNPPTSVTNVAHEFESKDDKEHTDLT